MIEADGLEKLAHMIDHHRHVGKGARQRLRLAQLRLQNPDIQRKPARCEVPQRGMHPRIPGKSRLGMAQRPQHRRVGIMRHHVPDSAKAPAARGQVRVQA